MSKEVNRGPQAEKSLNDFSSLSSNDWYQAPPEDAEAKQLRQAAKVGFLMNADQWRLFEDADTRKETV